MLRHSDKDCSGQSYDIASASSTKYSERQGALGAQTKELHALSLRCIDVSPVVQVAVFAQISKFIDNAKVPKCCLFYTTSVWYMWDLRALGSNFRLLRMPSLRGRGDALMPFHVRPSRVEACRI